MLLDKHAKQITEVIASLDASGFDYLQLEVGDMKLTVAKGVPAAEDTGIRPAVAALAAPAPVVAPVATPAPQAAAPQAVASVAPAARAADARPSELEGLVPIISPVVGKYYAQPEPGAAPFVTVGQDVVRETTVALVEVMKLFNAVPAGVKGRIEKVCVADGDFVQHGDVLFYVRPA